MKVVLFCGGQGTRLRDYSDQIPKPLVTVGQRPILWHLMKYYSYYGHNEFILCLGYGGHKIKQYFLQYEEWLTNDFVLTQGGGHIQMRSTDIDDWAITFVDTGLDSNVGERLRRVRSYLADDEDFLANYADGLSDLPLDEYVDCFRRRGKTACFVTVPVPQSFHVVNCDDEGDVTSLEPVTSSAVRINAGFFALRREVFDFMRPGEELVLQPFDRLIERNQLMAYPHHGFWRPMDTFKDKLELDRIADTPNPPWQVWSRDLTAS